MDIFLSEEISQSEALFIFPHMQYQKNIYGLFKKTKSFPLLHNVRLYFRV